MHGTGIKITEALQYKISWGRGQSFGGSRFLTSGQTWHGELQAAFLQH